MSWPDADQVHRTAKGLVDAGKADSPAEARRYLESLVLQVAVGTELAADPAAQAALATVVNAGHRAFLGGVKVRLDADPTLTTGWTAGTTASDIVLRYGGRVVEQLADDRPTLAIGQPMNVVGKPVLYPTWSGWVGAVVEEPEHRLNGEAHAVAGIIAGALGVSECFQHSHGAVIPGRRDVGVSLWRPDLPWRHDDAKGPDLRYLPAKLWLLGLGHLGQGYAWTLGMLPYAQADQVQIGLVDFDDVIDGNIATQLLVTNEHVSVSKARVVAAALETRGFATTIVERAFDEHFLPVRDEPTIALAGFDRPEPRRQLGGDRFRRVVDAGLGAGHVEYLDILLHTFPAAGNPAEVFTSTAPRAHTLPTAYEAEIDRQVEAGGDEGVVRCGMVEIAGISVGAAFVGAFTGALVVADLLRFLHEGMEYSVIGVDLRSPFGITAVPTTAPAVYAAPAYTLAS